MSVCWTTAAAACISACVDPTLLLAGRVRAHRGPGPRCPLLECSKPPRCSSVLLHPGLHSLPSIASAAEHG